MLTPKLFVVEETALGGDISVTLPPCCPFVLCQQISFQAEKPILTKKDLKCRRLIDLLQDPGRTLSTHILWQCGSSCPEWGVGVCARRTSTPPQPPFLSVSVWCAISAQRVLAGAANASYFQSSNQLRFFFNHLRNFKETSSHPEKMSNVFALLISSTQRTSSVNLSVLEPKISTGAQRGISVRIYCRQYFLKQG